MLWQMKYENIFYVGIFNHSEFLFVLSLVRPEHLPLNILKYGGLNWFYLDIYRLIYAIFVSTWGKWASTFSFVLNIYLMGRCKKENIHYLLWNVWKYEVSIICLMVFLFDNPIYLILILFVLILFAVRIPVKCPLMFQMGEVVENTEKICISSDDIRRFKH